MNEKILFVLPAGGYSGGANSVVQEVAGFLRMGLKAGIAVNRANYGGFVTAYASLPEITGALEVYSSPAELQSLLEESDVAVGTVATSVPEVVTAWEALPKANRPRLFYYIQDYEPFFFAKGSQEWVAARRSYDYPLIMRGFAKTDWICETVRNNHGLNVARVKASIDQRVFFPLFNLADREKPTISAMVRPSTRRRAPRRTCRIMNQLADRSATSMELVTFGCSVEELRRTGLRLDKRIDHRGRLTREQVADVLRRTDLFLDLSDYQAFGRTALEGMACGAVPVITLFGGAGEFIRHGDNGYACDVRYDSQIFGRIREYTGLPATSRSRLRLNAVSTAASYTVRAACLSILQVFAET